MYTDWCTVALYNSTTGPSMVCAPQVSTKRLKLTQICLYQKMSEKKVSLFFNFKWTLFLAIFWYDQPTYESMLLVVISCTVEYNSCTCVHKISWIGISDVYNLRIHAPDSDQLYSGVQQLYMCTQNILNCQLVQRQKCWRQNVNRGLTMPTLKLD